MPVKRASCLVASGLVEDAVEAVRLTHVHVGLCEQV